MSDFDVKNFDVKNLARLARIELSPQEEERIQSQIPAVLEFISSIQEAQVEEVAPSEAFSLVRNRWRDDEEVYQPGEQTEEIMRVAQNTKDGYFKVKKIIDHDAE